MKPAETAPKRGRFAEVIGPPDCPIMLRWTLVKLCGRKLMVHHFLPNADDRACHDHPSPFITMVLRGWYDDMAPCPLCSGAGTKINLPLDLDGLRTYEAARVERCQQCSGTTVVLRERMSAGAIRYRRAEHVHRTKVGPRGCWTVVLMGRKQRRWGFWHEGRWWFWREFERRFGFGMRCGGDG